MAMRLNVECLEGRETPSAAGLYAVGAGALSPPRVQVFDTTTGTRLADFTAFEQTFGGGVTVSVGDVNADGFPEVIVAAGPGGGPRVRVFDGRAFRAGAGLPAAPNNGAAIAVNAVMADFFAFEPSLNRGVSLTAGQVTGSATAEVIVGAGPGGGPRVRIFSGTAITTAQRQFNTLAAGDVTADFFAYESYFRNGVQVSMAPAGNLAVAPGLGGSPRIRLLNSGQIAAQGLAYTSFRAGDIAADFFAGNPSLRHGAYVSSADFNFDTIADIAVGSGPGTDADSVGTVTVYSGLAILNNSKFTGTAAGDVLLKFQPATASYKNGVTVGAAITSGNQAYLLTGVGDATLANQATVSRLDPVPGNPGAFTRTILRQTTINANFLNRPAVSN